MSFLMLLSCGPRGKATSLYRAGMKDFAAGRLSAHPFFVEAITNSLRMWSLSFFIHLFLLFPDFRNEPDWIIISIVYPEGHSALLF